MSNEIEVTDKLCECGTDHVMKGWRVCLACAQTRLMYPDIFDELETEPDKIEGEDGVTLAQVYGESREWKWTQS